MSQTGVKKSKNCEKENEKKWRKVTKSNKLEEKMKKKSQKVTK